MAVSVHRVTPNFSGVQYDGTNGADIAAELIGGQVVSDDGTTLVLTFTAAVGYDPYEVIMRTDQWFVYRRRGPNTDATGVFTDETFRMYWKPPVEMLDPADLAMMRSYLGTGVGTRTTVLTAGATGPVDTRVTPPVPAAIAGDVQIKSDILATGGVSLGSVTVAATPVIVTPYVAAGTVNGVLVPAHTLVRTQVTAGLGALSTVQVFTTIHY